MSTAHTVHVPPNLRAGDTFEVKVGGIPYFITVPITASGGSTLEVKIINPRSQHDLEIVPRNYPIIHLNTTSKKRTHDHIATFTIIRIAIELLLFIIVVLSFTLAPYSKIVFSDQCHVTNKRNGQKIYELYFNLFKGLSTIYDQCTTSADNFCMKWEENYAFWNTFDGITRNSNYYYTSANSANDWMSVSVLIPLSSTFVLLCAIFRLTIIYKFKSNREDSIQAIVCLVFTSALLYLLFLILLVCSINIIAFSSSSSPSAWNEYLQEVYSSGNNVKDNKFFKVVEAPTDCNIKINYDRGGSLLASALGLSVAVAILCAIAYCIKVATNGSPRNGADSETEREIEREIERELEREAERGRLRSRGGIQSPSDYGNEIKSNDSTQNIQIR